MIKISAVGTDDTAITNINNDYSNQIFNVAYDDNNKDAWISTEPYPLNNSAYNSDIFFDKHVKFELLDGTIAILKVGQNSSKNIVEKQQTKIKFLAKLPFFKKETTTYVEFFDENTKKTYQVKCDLNVFMNAIGVKYTDIAQVIFETALSTGEDY